MQKKGDPAGLQYKRARVYDPETGRFTQEDPIGLAGGLNLYGFANGDPVNFDDPFGLNPCVLGLPCPLVVGGAAAVGGPLTLFAAAVLGVVSLDAAFGTQGGFAGVGAVAAADATSFAARRSGKSLKKEWEGLHGRPWPAGCVAHHVCPLGDGGADDATNIEPKTPGDHVKDHKDNGDFKRWGGRRKQSEPQKDGKDPKEPGGSA